MLRLVRIAVVMDERFRQLLTRHKLKPHTHRLLRLYTRMGDGYVWAFTLIYLFWFYEWEQIRPLVHTALAAAAISLPLYHVIKLSVRRPRPYRVVAGVTAEVPPLDKFSFPSGHVMNNLAPGFAVWAANPDIGWLVVFMPLTWGFLRIYYGVHWLSDIIAGAFLGWLSYFLGLRAYAFFVG